jgi:hypothetical protein
MTYDPIHCPRQSLGIDRVSQMARQSETRSSPDAYPVHHVPVDDPITWPIQKIGRPRAVPNVSNRARHRRRCPVDLELGHCRALKSEPPAANCRPPIFATGFRCGLCRAHARLKAARRFSSLLNEIALPRSTALLKFSQQSGQSGNAGADFRTPQPRAGLTLDGSGHETTHVVTLQQQEQDQARDGHHHDASLRGTVVDGAHRLLPQVGHRERQGLLCAVG